MLGFKKKSYLLIVLFGIFLTNALLAELIGAKIFSLEALLSWSPAQLRLFGDLCLDFNLTAGVILWPVVFVTTDVINEYFGKSVVRKISFLAAGLIAFAFLAISVANYLPPAQFWLELNRTDPFGNPFDINYAFSRVYQQGMGIIIGSLTSFIIGQLLDATIFHYLRSMTKNKAVWLRATGSTLVSQFIDSFLVLLIAFYFFGNWNLEQILSVGLINYIYKFFAAVLLTPVIYLAHYAIDSYLGRHIAEDMIRQATGGDGR